MKLRNLSILLTTCLVLSATSIELHAGKKKPASKVINQITEDCEATGKLSKQKDCNDKKIDLTEDKKPGGDKMPGDDKQQGSTKKKAIQKTGKATAATIGTKVIKDKLLD